MTVSLVSNTLDKKLSLHPRYFTCELADTQILCLDELKPYILTGIHYNYVYQQLKSGVNQSELLQHFESFPQVVRLDCKQRQEGVGDIKRQMNMVAALNNLFRMGLLQENDAYEAQYEIPDYSATVDSWQLAEGNYEIRMLSTFPALNVSRRYWSAISRAFSCSIVVVDDYLDCRLAKISSEMTKRNMRWLIVKPTGVRQLIGPLFEPRSPSSLCWQCLKAAMLSNQPVRKWLTRFLNEWKIAIPVYTDLSYVKRYYTGLFKRLDMMKTAGMQHRVLTCQQDGGQVQFSFQSIHRNPACECCGDKTLFAVQVESPVVLRSCKKYGNSHGGTRARSADETLQRLLPYISEVCGPVREISQLTQVDKTQLKLYKSVFCKITQKNGNLTIDDFLQISLGKGVTDTQSRVSAIAEGMERLAAQYRGDEPFEFCSASSMADRFILPGELDPYSDKQIKRPDKNRGASHINPPDDVPGKYLAKYSADIAIHWTQCWSLTHDMPVFVPFNYCYAQSPFDENQYCRWNSNGCSAGNTLEDAILQGFFELVERDAAAIWWYNRVVRPQVDLDCLPKNLQELFYAELDSTFQYWVLNITHDLCIPVMVAIAQNRITGKFSFGFGCHFNPVVACERALSELCQIIPIRNKGQKAGFDFDTIEPEAFLLPDNHLRSTTTADFMYDYSDDIKNDILDAVNRMMGKGLEFLVLNYSRPELPLKTVKVIVPGLCHIWPRFANKRLYEVPVKLGWLDRQLSENELNETSLLI